MKYWPRFHAVAVCTFAALVLSYLLSSYDWRRIRTIDKLGDHEPLPLLPRFNSTGQTTHCIELSSHFPDSVYSRHHATYQQSAHSYWSKNAEEELPGCTVLPSNVQELSSIVKLLNERWKDDHDGVRFAVKSGGHSPERGFATIGEQGILIDMSLFNDVEVSEDEQSVLVGTGARWKDVSIKLDQMNLAVVGGRAVGVGGLILGGGISYFSPQYGMVCDNIHEYEIVLANGTIAQVTSTQHSDLWRALKGGTGNFGMVTRAKLRSFPSSKIWGGYLYWPSWQGTKLLKAFHEFNRPENFDKYAAGPILAFVYVQKIGLRLVAGNFVYTKEESWPSVFDGFKSIGWRVWNTMKVQSVTSMTTELAKSSPSGFRRYQVTTTIKNDLDTFLAFDRIYTEKLKKVTHIDGSIWSLVFQPLSAAVTRKGEPNVLGLERMQDDEALIIVLITMLWTQSQDDDLVYKVAQEMLSDCEDLAQRKGTLDQYRYLNYAGSSQDPFLGYGSQNKAFLQEVSKAYDPEGFFQRANQGGFKLDLY